MPYPAWAQIVEGESLFGRPQVIYSYWKLTDSAGTETKMTQTTAPFVAMVPLRDNLEARLFVVGASSNYKTASDDVSLSGLGDLRIQLNRSLSEDHILVSFGVNLPTGKKKLDFDKFGNVIEQLSRNFLRFPLRRYGEGLGFNLLIGGTTPLGNAQANGSVAYQMIGEYEPYDGLGDYNPGDRISASAGLSKRQGSLRWRADVTATTYVDDKVDGAKVFRQAGQFDIRLNATRISTSEQFSIGAFARFVSRGRNKIYDAATEEIRDQLQLFGDELTVSGRLWWLLSPKLSATPTVEYRRIGADEDLLDESSVVGLGGSLGLTASEEVSFAVRAMYYSGDADGGSIDLTGLQAGLSLKAVF